MMSSATVLVLAAVLLTLVLAGFGTYRGLRKGGCCGNCADCSNCRSAPINIKEEDE